MTNKHKLFLLIPLLLILTHTSQLAHAGLTMCGLLWWDNNTVLYFQEQSSQIYYLISDSVANQFISRPADSCGTWGSFYFEDIQVERVSPPKTLSFYNGSKIVEWRIISVGRFVCIAHREGMCPALPTDTPLPPPTNPPTATQIPPTTIPPSRTPIPPTTIPPTRAPISPTNTVIIPTATRVLPTNTAVSIQPSPTPNEKIVGNPLPKNGYEPGLTLLERILQIVAPPVDASNPADCQARFTPNNCTWFVAGKRPDACQWITPGQGNAYQWVSQALTNGSAFGVTVRKSPQVGDIAVWSQGCGGTPTGTNCNDPDWACGHVAIVTWVSFDERRIKIQEMNWSFDRSNIEIHLLDCMSFISQPDGSNNSSSSAGNSSNHTVTPPVPVPVPTPIQPSTSPLNIIDWLRSLFGG